MKLFFSAYTSQNPDLSISLHAQSSWNTSREDVIKKIMSKKDAPISEASIAVIEVTQKDIERLLFFKEKENIKGKKE